MKKPVCPWKPCARCLDAINAREKCVRCHGLGLELTKEWLASEWTLLLVIDRNQQVIGPLLDPVCRYRLMPPHHPGFAKALDFASSRMLIDGVAHIIESAEEGLIKIARSDGNPSMKPYRIEVLLLEGMRPKLRKKKKTPLT